MTKIIVLTNNKGGVGKSTSATNIALGLTEMLRQLGASKQQVLLIDTDSQSHATLVTTGRDDFDTTNSLYSVVMSPRDDAIETLLDVIVPSQWDDDLHVLPASQALEQAERELTGTAGAPYRLRNPLAKIASQYAAVLIDTRPSFSLMTEMALVAATDAIIPVEPRYLETVGLLSVINKIHDIRDGWFIENLKVSGLLVTKMDRRVRGHREMLTAIKEHPILGKLLCGVIPANEALSYAHHHHLSVFNYNPKASASKAYARVVGNLINRMAQGVQNG